MYTYGKEINETSSENCNFHMNKSLNLNICEIERLNNAHNMINIYNQISQRLILTF